MGIRITWQDTNASEQGHRVYRSASPMNPENLPVPLVELGPDVEEYEDGSVVDGETWYYRVSAFSGGAESVGAEIVKTAEAGGGGSEDDFANAQIGDEIGGGIYAGIETIGGADYHIIVGKADSEAAGLQWKTSQTSTSGTTSNTDGLANTQAMETAGLANHPAAEHCLNYSGGGYTDWHMPARSQLTLVYNNLAGHAEFAETVSSAALIWASTESSAAGAWWRRLSDGNESNTAKTLVDSALRTRPIRRVPVNP